jgi:AcrR family transcriptional regulator
MKIYTPRSTLTPTQRRILESTVQTIADVGYAQTTIGEISQRLGISKGVVQYHFPSKESLIQESIAYIYTVARDYMSAQIWQTTNEWSQIRSFIKLSGQFYQKYPIHIQALHVIRADFQPQKHISLAATLHERELTDLANVFIAGQQKGVFRHFDPDIAATTLRLALNGIAGKLKDQQPYDVTKYTGELIELFYRAFYNN